MINAEFLMLLGGCGAFIMTLYWVRVRELRERYAIGWLAVATLLLLTGLFPDVLKRIADWAHLSYPALVLFVALGLIYLNSFFVSVALTKHYRWNVRLTQQMALLEERLRRLEEKEEGSDPFKTPENETSPANREINPRQYLR